MTAPVKLRGFDLARQRMVDSQLKARDITSPKVLAAMGEVPRHLFVDKALGERAYDDGPLPIGYKQTISQPYIVALMTQLLDPAPADRILEVGSGCGYQTAVLARLAGEVFAIERIEALRDKTIENLAKLGVSNAAVRLGDGRLGWPEKAPFQGVLVAAFAERIPTALVEQLAPGGRIIIPVGPEESQDLVLGVKDDKGSLVKKVVVGCRFVPLV